MSKASTTTTTSRVEAWAICSACSGEGHYANPAFNDVGVEFWKEDPELTAAYFSGLHDISCTTCNGTGKVKALVARAAEEITEGYYCTECSEIFEFEDVEVYSYQEYPQAAETSDDLCPSCNSLKIRSFDSFEELQELKK